MARTQFGAYRRAFDALLDCTAECTDGWIRDVRPLMPDFDAAFTRTLMAYYVDVLKRSKPCGE